MKSQEELRGKMEDAISNENIQKFLHVIRQAEFNHASTKDVEEEAMYSTGYGFKKLDSLSDHPAILSDSPKQMFSGAYQIGKNTWMGAKDAMGLPNFEAHSQDLAATWLIYKHNQLDRIVNGGWLKALPFLTGEWASFPGGHYNQPAATIETLKAHYKHYDPN